VSDDVCNSTFQAIGLGTAEIESALVAHFGRGRSRGGRFSEPTSKGPRDLRIRHLKAGREHRTRLRKELILWVRKGDRRYRFAGPHPVGPGLPKNKSGKICGASSGKFAAEPRIEHIGGRIPSDLWRTGRYEANMLRNHLSAIVGPGNFRNPRRKGGIRTSLLTGRKLESGDRGKCKQPDPRHFLAWTAASLLLANQRGKRLGFDGFIA